MLSVWCVCYVSKGSGIHRLRFSQEQILEKLWFAAHVLKHCFTCGNVMKDANDGLCCRVASQRLEVI